MPLYEYDCPVHGVFENIGDFEDDVIPCERCGAPSPRLISRPSLIRVHHSPIPDPNDSLRVYDRRRMLKDTAVQKSLNNYKEQQHEKLKAGEIK